MSLTCYFIQGKQGETKWKGETHDKNNKLGPFKTNPSEEKARKGGGRSVFSNFFGN